jgi:hypothetical protein
MVSVLAPVSPRSLARSQQSPVDSSPPGLTYAATPTEMEAMGRTKSAGTGSNKGRHGMAWHGLQQDWQHARVSAILPSPMPGCRSPRRRISSSRAGAARRGAPGSGSLVSFQHILSWHTGGKIFRGLCSWLYLSASYPRSRNLDAPSRVVDSLNPIPFSNKPSSSERRRSRGEKKGKGILLASTHHQGVLAGGPDTKIFIFPGQELGTSRRSCGRDAATSLAPGGASGIDS